MGIHKITTLSAIAAMALMPLVSSAATGTVATGSTTSSALHEELNVPGAPVLVSSTATSATLSWAKVTAATSYVVKYSKNSVAEAFKAGKTAVYEIETDPVTATGTTIKDLATGNMYYFAVVALDKDNNESATNSPELAAKISAETAVAAPTTTAITGMTATPATTSNFKLSSVVASSTKSLSLEFSAPLSTTTPVTLKISKTLDNSAVAVASVVVDTKDAKKATVSLAGALDPSSSYSVTIISAKDATGLTIAEGINAIKEFATSANLAVAAGTTPVALNAAPTASGATGATLSGATVPATATATATGTQQNLLLMFAAILSLGIIYVARRKRA